MKIYKKHSKFIIVALLGMLSFTKIYAQPAPPNGQSWQKIDNLSDEFDFWDTTKWQKPLWNYGVPVQMVAQNSGVNDGKLWIKATLDNNSERWFQTSRVMSNAQIKYPMYTECKIRTAHISAFNTFWLNNGNSANRDEIDVVENNSNPSCNCRPKFPWQMNSQYFQVINSDVKRDHGNFDNRNLSDNNPLKGVRWNEQYHTVGVWWKDEKNIQFYLNGEPAGKVVSARNFTRDLSIIWDLWTKDVNWLGGIAKKSDLANNSVNTMYVDWVHTYSLVDATLSTNDEQFSENEIKVYPNPVIDILNIDLTGSKDAISVEIYDNAGRLLKRTSLNNNTNQISVSEFSSGIYFVKVLKNGASKVYSVVKE